MYFLRLCDRGCVNRVGTILRHLVTSILIVSSDLGDFGGRVVRILTYVVPWVVQVGHNSDSSICLAEVVCGEGLIP